MLQKTYSVYSDDVAGQHLFIELGKNHLACWCKKEAENKFTAFEFFQCDNYDASVFDSFINEVKLNSKLLSLDVASTNIFWNTTEKLAVPSTFATDNFIYENFCLMTGCNSKDKLFISQFDDASIITSIDSYLNTVALKIFPQANFNGCEILKAEQSTIAYLLFYPNYFSFIVYAEGKLQFIQTKRFTNADDVLYFILNVFHQYKIEKNIDVVTGGYINEDSKLFQTLYQYIENLKLAVVEENMFSSSVFKEYPSHYFLPYINHLS